MRLLLPLLLACTPQSGPVPVSSVYAQDTFTGASAVTSGPAPNPATTNVTEILYVSFVMPPTTGDRCDWIVHFPTGDVIARLRFTSATQLVFERVVTIGGTSTTTIATYNSPTGNFPLDGATGHLHFRVTLNTGSGTTTVTLGWRGTLTPATASSSTSFNLSGLLTPTSAEFVITGGAPVVQGPDLDGRVPDGGGNAVLTNGMWAWRPARSAIGGVAMPPETEGSSDGRFVIVNAAARHQFPSNAQDFEFDNYVLAGISNLGTDYSVEVTGQYHPNASGYSDGASFGPMARVDPDGFGYKLVTFSNPFPAPGIGINGYILELQRANPEPGDEEEAVETVLASVVVDPDDPPPLDTDITVRLCVSNTAGGVRLQGFLDGERLIDVEDTDADALLSGDPGLQMSDDTDEIAFSFLNYGLLVSRVTVSAQDDGAPGGGGGTPGTDAFLWARRNQAWHPVPTPGPDTGAVVVRANLAPRVVRAAYVRANLAFRPLAASVDPEINGNPGDGQPDIGCIDVTDLVPVDPEPLTDKLFFCYDLNASLINNSPWSAAVKAMGPWIIGDIATAAGRGGSVIGAQGGYEKFRTGGVYDPDKMDAFIASHAGIMPAVLAAQTAGSFYGVQIADDFDAVDLWPPSGLSNAELSRIAALWQSSYPGIRTVLRARTVQVASRPGALSHVDTFISQFRQGLGSIAAFHAAELAAASSVGISGMLWSLNYLNGGDGSSGLSGTRAGKFLMSPAEIAAYYAELASGDAYIHGVGGWRYDTRFLAQPGIIAALTAGRNALALL